MPLKRKMDLGRAACADDLREGTWYTEYSADPNADPGDPETWRSCNPAMGVTIEESSLRHSHQTMEPASFGRQYLCLFSASDERVIPVDTWNAVLADDARADGGLVLGLDVSPARTDASLAVSDSEANVELIEHRQGIGEVVEMAIRLAKKLDCGVAIDATGPAASLIGQLEAAEVVVYEFDAATMRQACARFFDKVADRKV